MVFSSPIFLFLFLPLVLLIYYLSWGTQLRNFILLIASLIFYAWGEGQYIVLMLTSIVFNYLFGILLDLKKENELAKKMIVALAVIVNIGLLGYFKYFNFILPYVDLLLGTTFNVSAQEVHLPIGISFFTFQSMSYVIDIYRKQGEVQKQPLNLALYISLFPQLIAGPIVRYMDVSEQLISRLVSFQKFELGAKRFILGLAKKVLIANTMGAVADEIMALPVGELPIETAWLGILCYSLQIYFDFSGYSDMAIGLGKMFGFDFLENFNYPYISKSIKEFWRRWHISLSNWFKDYLYIPLGGNRVASYRIYLNLFIVFFITGLWHGASWSFVIWGLYHGLFLVIERLGFERLLNQLWAPLRHLYVLLMVVVGWVFFRIETLPDALQYLGSMFGFGLQNRALFYLDLFVNYKVWFFFGLGLLFSTPLFHAIKAQINRHSAKHLPLLRNVLVPLGYLVLFTLAAGSIAGETYNPFIYFRF